MTTQEEWTDEAVELLSDWCKSQAEEAEMYARTYRFFDLLNACRNYVNANVEWQKAINEYLELIPTGDQRRYPGTTIRRTMAEQIRRMDQYDEEIQTLMPPDTTLVFYRSFMQMLDQMGHQRSQKG